MPAFSLVVLVATLVLVSAQMVKDKTPPVTIMPSGSFMAGTTLAYFSGSNYSAVVLQKVTSEPMGEATHHYHWETEVPIKSVHLIPPHHFQIDGSERHYAERFHHLLYIRISNAGEQTPRILPHKSGHQESTWTWEMGH